MKQSVPNHFHRFFELSIDMLCIAGVDGYFKVLNPAWEEVLGFSQEELKSKPFLDFVHPDDVENTLSEVEKLSQGQSVINFENRYRTKKGDFKWLSWKSAPQGEDIYAIARDITDQKQLEAQQANANQQLQQFLDAVPIGIYVLDKNGIPAYANIRSQEILGKGIDPNITEKDLGKVYKVFESGTNTIYPTEKMPIVNALKGESTKISNMEVDRNSKRIPLEVNAAPILNNAGEIEFAIATFEDINARRELESQRDLRLKEMELSETRLKKFLEAIPIGVYVLDRDGKPYYANARSKSILGRGIAQEASKEDLSEIYHAYLAGTDQLYPSGNNPIVKALGKKSTKIDDIEIQKNGNRIPLQVTGAPILAEDGTVEFAIAVFEDITKRKSSERKLRKYLKELEKANSQLDQFAYVVSHDLKAPLRGISSIAQWISEDFGMQIPPEVEKHLVMLKNRVRRMENLINGILAYSRAGRQQGPESKINVRMLVKEIIELFPKEEQNRITISDQLPQVKAEKIQLTQVFSNLISNGLKYSDPVEGKVIISGKQSNGFAEYSVRDNGTGIENAYQEKIFGIFQRLHSRDDIEGAGIGLSIVKKIVEERGGKVTLISEPGKGSDFRFTWPLEQKND